MNFVPVKVGSVRVDDQTAFYVVVIAILAIIGIAFIVATTKRFAEDIENNFKPEGFMATFWKEIFVLGGVICLIVGGTMVTNYPFQKTLDDKADGLVKADTDTISEVLRNDFGMEHFDTIDTPDANGNPLAGERQGAINPGDLSKNDATIKNAIIQGKNYKTCNIHMDKIYKESNDYYSNLSLTCQGGIKNTDNQVLIKPIASPRH